MQKLYSALIACVLLTTQSLQAEPRRPECIAPAKPGGGFDLTCKLAVEGFKDAGLVSTPIRVTYMPGGVGAVAYNKVVANKPKDGNAIIAFSTGSLLNLSQGKFGKYTVNDVRWLAGIGTDYGMVAVRADSPYQTLEDLAKALEKDPKSVTFGAGGSVGGQDWMQVAIMAKKIGIDPKAMKYVALEGGGETVTNLLGGHIDVMSAGIAEVVSYLDSGKVRVLAVFSDQRLGGKLQQAPTAKEQGYDIQWPVIRGFYVGPQVSDQDFLWWKEKFDTLLASEDFNQLRIKRDLLPFSLTGDALTQYVQQQVNEMHTLSKEFNLLGE